MAVNLNPPNPQNLNPVAGVKIGVAQAGIKKAGKDDLTLFLFEDGANIGAVFTQNRFCAAPVIISRENLEKTKQTNQKINALIINTGNANAGTGEQGLKNAHEIINQLALRIEKPEETILPFSTGVIMEPLPYEKIIAALQKTVENARETASEERSANPHQWGRAASAIMTTDTVSKAASTKIQIQGSPINITGISKGAGMICPNMATMLGFIATDANIAPELMQEIAKKVADKSFNNITIDGDTSTNDSFIIISTQKADNPQIQDLQSPEGQELLAALTKVAQQLAQAIVRDGEGATKFITINIKSGKTQEENQKIARAIAQSPLVKTAFFASDPNLGRILAAIGYAGINDLDTNKIDMKISGVQVVEKGARYDGYTEEQGQAAMSQSEIEIQIELGRGKEETTIWTCDLSHEYVSINADYRS